MAHKIDNSRGKGKDAFVSYGAPAWHGLGITFDTPLGAQQALEAGQLDFEVRKMPNIHAVPIFDENGNYEFNEIISEESFFTYRTDVNTVLAPHVGSDYTVLQNSQCFELVDEILQSGTAAIESAGAIDGGRKVFICLKYTTPIVVGSSDEVSQYVLIATSHDAKLSITALPTNIRVVCNNTLTAALRNAQGAVKIRHSANAMTRLEEAAKVLQLLHDNTQINCDNYNLMREHKISNSDMFDYFGNIFFDEKQILALQAGKSAKDKDIISTQKQNILEEVRNFAVNGTGQDLAFDNGLNMWGAYHAVTGYITRKKYKNENERAKSMLFGTSADIVHKAGVLAMEPETIKPLRATASGIFTGMSLN